MDTTDRSFFLEIAAEIIGGGRIADLDDWEEMRLELEREFIDRKIAVEMWGEGLQFIKKMWFPEKSEKSEKSEEPKEPKQKYIRASEDERSILFPIFCALLGRARGREFLRKKASLQELQGVAVQLINDIAYAGERAAKMAGLTSEQPSLWAKGEIQERARLRPSEWLKDLEKIKARGEILYVDNKTKE